MGICLILCVQLPLKATPGKKAAAVQEARELCSILLRPSASWHGCSMHSRRDSVRGMADNRPGICLGDAASYCTPDTAVDDASDLSQHTGRFGELVLGRPSQAGPVVNIRPGFRWAAPRPGSLHCPADCHCIVPWTLTS